MKRLKACHLGCVILKIFCVALVLSVIYLVAGFSGMLPGQGNIFTHTKDWLLRLLGVVVIDNTLFWPGIVLVYTTSKQLGLRWRVWGIVCGMIPIAQLVMLYIIISTASEEVRVETAKIKKNAERKADQICKTKYPILMVHGVFFRDFEHLNYWGRIPGELIQNGATVYYGNHNSAAAVADSAKELAARIRTIIEETGCEKLNVIAHSKGGLDMRTAICKEGIAPYIASLTTVNTPHRGCEFADYILNKMPDDQEKAIAAAYNTAAAKLGDVNPDFLAAVYDLTHEKCIARNEEIVDQPGIYYQSVGSKLNHHTSGRFPLNLTYYLVKYFDGANDGLVGEKSFPWGSKYRFLTVQGNRGISHGDMIDLNRENFEDFDVREFFVGLVEELKAMGF